MEKIEGYKAFDKGLINRYGMRFKEGQTYHTSGFINFGNRGNGWHFCLRLEDTLRYFDAMDSNIDICEVIGSGQLVRYDDEYYGYYDMYVCSDIYIKRVIPRSEIIKIACNMNVESLERFISGYRLTKDELSEIRQNIKFYKRLEKTISYYQYGNMSAFK